jgi:hypothetical protein
MKRYIIITSILVFLLATGVMANDYPKSNIRFNLGGWGTSNSNFGIRADHRDVGNNERVTDVELSGLSAGFALSHMVDQRFAWEVSLGGLSDSEIKTRYKDYDDYYYETTYSKVHSVSVSYMAAGLLYYPLSELSHFEENTYHRVNSVIRPYVSAGLGYYFGVDVTSNEDDVTDADFDTTEGGFVGVGLDLVMSRHFLFNVDLRYHFVEFDALLNGESDYSGTNILAGFKIAF